MRKYVSAGALCAPLAAVLFVGVLNTAALAQTLPSPWTAKDIGAPALSGSATHASGIFTIQGAGSDIWGASDQFMFVYRQVAGDVDIIARMDDLDGSNAYGKAGVMIRASLNANAAHAYSHVTVGAGVRYVRRVANGGTSTVKAGTSAASPIWVRAMRKGSQVTSYWSTTGTSWTAMGTDTIALGSSAYVGIAVNSRNTGARAIARVSNVTVTGQSLPAGQKSMDIGAPAIAGSVAHSSGKYTIKAAGFDIWDTADQFHYVYQPVTGNLQVVARVASITNAHAWSKAGVMIRESLTAQSRHAMTAMSVSKGYAFQRRADPGVYSEHTSGGSGTAPGWVKLVRTGDLFESFRSANGTAWTKIGSDTIPMGDTVYVGIAATSHNTTLATTAVVDSFKVTSAASGNQSPAVSITSPLNGAQVTAPVTVSLSATATDPENRMASVDFYVGSTLLVRDTTAPYTASWPASAAGTYALTAVAHDADGGSSTSSVVSVTVKTATVVTPPKMVVFTASTDHATKVTKYVLKVYAAGANTTTATPVATSDLGKPVPAAGGDITVDRSAFLTALAAGNYQATVTAVGPGGQSASAPTSFTR